MRKFCLRRLWILPGIFALSWLIMRWVLPFLLPFLLGWALAAVVQPQIRFLTGRLHLPRSAASAVSVTAGLVLLGVSAVGLLGILCREAAVLIRGLPGAVEVLGERAALWEGWALARTAQLPPMLAGPMQRGIRELFTGGSVLVEKLSGILLSAAGKAVGGISGGAMTAGTAILASYLTASCYPRLRAELTRTGLWKETLQPVLCRLREVLGGWLKAQLKLSGVTFGLVLGGFFLLGVEQPILWAALTAVVDAVPMLGTGTVLLPMALLSMLWGNRMRSLGLLGLYVGAVVLRSALEPRLVGKQLGLPPLGTLFAIYAGFRLWGIPGMILSPVLAVLSLRLAAAEGCE